jgi:micrococcal nuclease
LHSSHIPLSNTKLQPSRLKTNTKPSAKTPVQRKNKKAKQQQEGTTKANSLSPIYGKLPLKATKCSVWSVYDGDTVTIYNKKRVRLLGIDTPELKNPTQAFSQEAKEYTRVRCEKQPIWLSFEPSAPKEGSEDRYGRLLAWVWVQTGDGRFECVNEGLLQAGLATVYTVSNANKLQNIDKLVAMQKEARCAQRGMWTRWHDFTVVKTCYGTAFHHRNAKCEHLKRSTNIRQILASEAMDDGRHACRTCLGDDDVGRVD